MKNLKYISFALMLFIGFSSIQAQQKGLTKKDEMITNDRTSKKVDHKRKMHKELNLTPEQTKQIKEIRAKRADKKATLKNEMKQLNKAERDEIRAVYTPEQQAKLKEMREKRKENLKTHQGKKKMQRKKMQNRKQR